MKLIKKLFIAFLITGTFIQISCKKQLNALPGQTKVEGNVVIDQNSAEIALNGAYLAFADGGDDRGTPSARWVSFHEIQPSIVGGNLQGAYSPSELQDNNLITSNLSAVSGLWTRCYTLINTANGVISQISALADNKFTGNRKTEMLAEARLLRAYGHYNLLRYFSQFYDLQSEYGALLRLEFVNTTNIGKKRSTVRETYDAILADLDDAIVHAPVNRPNYYANTWVAKALKARVLILRGGTADYTDVANISKDIIDNSPYKLEGKVRDIFSTKGITSGEVMLGIFPKPGQATKADALFFREFPQYLVTDAYKNLFSSTDPRTSWMFAPAGTESSGGLTKYFGAKPEDCYALRLTEIYLLRAEAIVRSGGSLIDARTLVKTVMSHAEVLDYSAVDNAATAPALLVEIYKEVARNLSFEDGQDWTTLIRLPLATVLQIKPSVTDKNHLILPIPSVEFQYNPAVGEQNPGYNRL
jgi:hypothetical protein